MSKETVYLDLDKVDLFGWQTKTLKPHIDYLVRSIGAGHELPAVNIFKINDSTYQLIKLLKPYDENGPTNGIDGGHRRAYAYYQAGKPLECLVIGIGPNVDFGENQNMPVNIRDLVLDDTTYAHEKFIQDKEIDPNYRKLS